MSNEKYWIRHEEEEQNYRNIKAAIAWLNDQKRIKKRTEHSMKLKGKKQRKEEKRKIEKAKLYLNRWYGSKNCTVRIIPVDE